MDSDPTDFDSFVYPAVFIDKKGRLLCKEASAHTFHWKDDYYITIIHGNVCIMEMTEKICLVYDAEDGDWIEDVGFFFEMDMFNGRQKYSCDYQYIECLGASLLAEYEDSLIALAENVPVSMIEEVNTFLKTLQHGPAHEQLYPKRCS